MHTAGSTYRRSATAFALILAAIALLAMSFADGADARRKASIPANNYVKNPSFKKSTKGWFGFQSKVRRVRVRHAPDGRSVAVVHSGRRADTYTIDDSRKSVKGSIAGRTYTGTAWVRGWGRSVGKPVSLVVREWGKKGGYVDSGSTRVRLTRKWRPVDVRYRAEKDDGLIDIYIARPEGSVVKNDRFGVDAITLTGKQTSGTKPPGPANPAGGLTTSQIAIVNDHEPSLLAQDGSQYSYLLVRDSMHGELAQLRAAHPEAKLILYKDVAFTVQDEPGCPYYPFQGAGVSYCQADSHEDWFLHGSAGNRLSSSSYTQQRAMNVANPAYRQAWVDSVLARLSDADNDGSGVRYDGVFMDDTNMYPGHGMDGRIAELSDDDYRNAMVDFVDSAAGQIRAAGFETVANVGMDPWTPAQRAATLKVAADVDAVNREGLIRWGEGGSTWTENDGETPFWEDEVKLAEDIQKAGASFQAITYGSLNDVGAQRYARATFLLAWNGDPGSAQSYRTPAGESWSPDWTSDVGVPTSGRYEVGQGWRRDFAAGTVVINPRATGSQKFSLGGSFREPNGKCVGSVTLGATQALVMPAC
jgi:hypothetical protein